MSYRLLALRDLPHLQRPAKAGEVFTTWSLGLACALVRQQAAEPVDARTAADCELGLRLQELRNPGWQPGTSSVPTIF